MSTALVVRRRLRYGQRLYWVGRVIDGTFVFYADTYAPTGYGFKDKTMAIAAAQEIEERLSTQP